MNPWSSLTSGEAASTVRGRSKVLHYHQFRDEDFDKTAGVAPYADESANKRQAVARPMAQSVARTAHHPTRKTAFAGP